MTGRRTARRTGSAAALLTAAHWMGKECQPRVDPTTRAICHMSVHMECTVTTTGVP